MTSRDLRLPVLAACTFAAAAAVVFLTLSVWPVAVSSLLIALVLAAMLSEWLAVEFSSVHVSITYAVCAAAIILLGPSAGAIVGGISAIPPVFLERDRPIVKHIFNVGQLTLTGAAAGWAYVELGGRMIAGSPLAGSEMPSVILAVAALAIATFAVNTTLMATAVTIVTGGPFLSIWKSTFMWTIPGEGALTVLALALAQVVASEGSIGLILFFVPLMIARQFYERYVRLRRAYADTVRSLVAVIEAKDAYTRGHSERVAVLAVETARRIGFTEQRLERLELAALLHDLGKVGISRSIISKPSRLSDEEFEVIKSHPRLGADIVESVPFLADLVPYIAAHHERVDGSGYGAQLMGEQIPLEGRVLSVADAYDAMTSSRPYRRAMVRDEAVAELRRCAGSQFDADVVEVFVEGLESADPMKPSRNPPTTVVEAADEAV